mgnify:FL=1
MRRWALCLLLATTLSCQAADSGDSSAALISVTGQGSVSAAPDMATVTLGVTTQAQDAATAVTANNQGMTALHSMLDTFDIDDNDRRSRGFSIQPRYDNRRSSGGSLAIVGFTVSNQLTVRVRKLDELGDLLGAAVQSGSNTINSLSFGNSDVEAFLDDARRLAIENALHKASLYAESAGGKVGRIVSMSEAGAPQPRPEMRNAGAMMMAAESVPIAAGENEYRAAVNVVFEFEQ